MSKEIQISDDWYIDQFDSGLIAARHKRCYWYTTLGEKRRDRCGYCSKPIPPIVWQYLALLYM